MERPRIAITMGDAAGVGPEIIMKALGHADLFERCRPLVVGDAGRLRQAGEIVGSRSEVRPVAEPDRAAFRPGLVDCIDLGLIPPDLPWGRLSPVAGDGAFRFIERAVELATAGKVEAICTAPLNKEALHSGGHLFPGHTEMLAALTGTPEVSMMLMTPKLRVIHVTTHIGLLDAIAKIEPGLVERTILRGHEALVRSGLARPVSGCAASTPMRVSTGCSVTARRRKRSSRRSTPFGRAGSRRRGRCPPIPCSSAPNGATSISSSLCTTTKGTGP